MLRKVTTWKEQVKARTLIKCSFFFAKVARILCNSVIFQFLMVVIMKIGVIWDVTLCYVDKLYHTFRGMCCCDRQVVE